MNKKELRLKMKEVISLIDNKEERSSIIAEQLLNTDIYKNASAIGIYLSTENEVNTSQIIKQSFLDNKKIYVPVLNDNNMDFYQILPEDSFTTNKYNIKEPVIKRNQADNLDLIIVPCVAIDKQGNRLGHGKGYYDRYLKDKNANIITICFRQQVLPHIPHDNLDIKINAIIYD